MYQQPNHSYEFGPFRLNVAERQLCHAGEVLPLQPKAFDILLVLVERHGHLIGKDELLQAVWPDAVVEEINLSNNISLLRKALGDNPQAHNYIETVPKRGYRFVAEVRVSAPGDATEQQPSEGVSETVPTPGHAARSWRWVLATCVVLLSLGFSYFWNRRTVPPASVVPPLAFTSLAVLPFKPLTAESHDEALGLGMADTLIMKLGGLRHLIVRPTSAVRKYINAEQDPLAAGREQQVEAVLDAHMQRVGDKLRVTVRQLNGKDGDTIWA